MVVEDLDLLSWYRQVGELEHDCATEGFADALRRCVRVRQRAAEHLDPLESSARVEDLSHPVRIGVTSKRGVEHREGLPVGSQSGDITCRALDGCHRDPVDDVDVLRLDGGLMSDDVLGPFSDFRRRHMDLRQVGPQHRQPVHGS
ncbi:hypothetical protein [Gordonia hongkongensis]|uniref:hypothetical protein n=1 Tax=Gordonia hongkongensis TaxID=1701090 RepID=UPI0013F60686|nr:hypothetical protein G8C36_18390 [Gordonia terrae]